MPEDSHGMRPLSRKDPAVSRILRQWRRLTTPAGRPRAEPGADVVIACSGGADSSALALALAATGRRFVLAHVLHDMRPRAEAKADADAAADLARRLGFEFVLAEVSVRSTSARSGRRGNAEAIARAGRYEALADIALERNLGFVATAHHATDQLETVLMGLLRGSGPRGMSGVAPRRLLARDFSRPGRERRVYAVRPMLGVTREDSERLCREAGWEWRHDATNDDASRLRAAVRQSVVPLLRSIRPGCEARASWSAEILRSAAAWADAFATELCEAALAEAEARCEQESMIFLREHLSDAPMIVRGETLRTAAGALSGGRGLDRLGRAALEPVMRAIADMSGEVRVFDWGSVEVQVEPDQVVVRLTKRGRTLRP